MVDQGNSPPPAIQHWLSALSDDLEKRKRAGLFRDLSPVLGPQGAEINIGGKTYLQFCTNNYLGLAGDPEVIHAAHEALDRWGFGSGASRLVAGSMESHHQLETGLAEFKHAQAALIFSSGYAANMAVLTTFAQAGDLILSDKLNHASLLDAAFSSGARCRTFQHRHYDRLGVLLNRRIAGKGAGKAAAGTAHAAIWQADSEDSDNEYPSPDGRVWIVTDTVFSMDGDLADMAALARIARHHGALLAVDEAHATGVLGPDGRGVSALAGVERDVAISVGTLSKALGAIGGFVTGPRPVIDTLINRSRQLIYTTSLPAACTAAARTALLISRREPQRRQRVLTLAAHVRAGLLALGYQIGASESPIIPVLLGSAEQALAAAAFLRGHGIYIPAIRPPTVPPNTSRLRISLMATHTDGHIEQLLSAMAALRHHQRPNSQ
jgi:7-keto-8-aminopelargonate synthetase-like enzyme